MKARGLLHARLLHLIGELGHTDTFVVGDAGLPVPPGVEKIDLAVALGTPPLDIVLDTILGEVVLEGAVLAEEARHTPAHGLFSRYSDRLGTVEEVSHEELKALCRDARFVVRTGETTPYANVVLRCGVPF